MVDQHGASRDARSRSRSQPGTRDDGDQRSDRQRRRSSGSDGIGSVVASARRQLEELLGHPVDRVSSVTRQDGGWRVGVDVVELARVPDSTSVLGSYEVILDRDGEVMEFERTRRFYRNRADEEAL